MNNGLITLAILVCLTGANVIAQDSDLARIEYSSIPQANSENSVSRFRALINFPIRMKWEDSYLVLGIEYRNLDLDFNDPVPFSVETLGKLQLFRTTVAYTFKMKRNWRFAAKVGLEVDSNFEESRISRNDTKFTGALFLIKSKMGDDINKPTRFIIGLNYSTNAGRPFPIPIINYYRKFRPNWSFSVGPPKSNLKHFLTKKQTLQAFITLDGFFSNIQNNLEINNNDGTVTTADNISMTLVLGGVGYEYFFTKNLLVYVYGGHTFYNEIRLRDTNRNNLFKINEENTIYLRTGVKFKI